MIDIIALLQCVDQTLNTTTLRQLAIIAQAMLPMTGRVTMLGISRWTEKGGSYRTIQRFFNNEIVWSQINWVLIKQYLWDGKTKLLVAGDETVVTKSGKKTFGLDRFFASLFGKPVAGLSFFSFSVINPETRLSSVVSMEQLNREESTNQRGKQKQNTKSKKKKKRGRPKGSKNKNHRDVILPAHLQKLQKLLQQVLDLIGNKAVAGYCLLDGAFGNNNALQMVRRCGLDIVSKLRRDAALYLPYTGEQKKRGARRKYGQKLDYANLPTTYCVSETVANGIKTSIYNMVCWHKFFPDQLNIVVIVKVNVQTKKRLHVILFSSDLALSWEKLIDYYKLRFQIEFNFRDAKQYWGLEDFMNVNQLPVYNAANLAMFMGNLSQVLRRKLSVDEGSIPDLKSQFRGHWYGRQVLKLLPISLDPLLIEQIFAEIYALVRIHPVET
jgi:hypothetical protein